VIKSSRLVHRNGTVSRFDVHDASWLTPPSTPLSMAMRKSPQVARGFERDGVPVGQPIMSTERITASSGRPQQREDNP